MTDEQMDGRLRRAGEAWRAANEATAAMPTAVAEDVHIITPGPARKVRHTGLLASAAVVAAALVAGGIVLFNGVGHHPTTSTDQAVALKGTVWRLVGYGNDQPRTNSLATLYIGKDDRMVADDGCTLIGARVSTDGGRIGFSDFDERYGECTDTAGEITFTRAVDILTSFPHYSIDRSQLTIGGMHFLAAPELPAPTLDVPTFLGAKWRLVRVTDAQGQDQPVSGSPTLQVNKGMLSASDGCNALSGPAAVGSNEIDLKHIGTTYTVCTGQVGETAAAIDAFFKRNTLHEQVEGTILTLKGNGVGELVYRWVPDDNAATDPANLIGRDWQLVSAAGDPSAGRATLRIDGANLSGNDGCAELNGRADLGRGTLTVTGVPEQPAASCADGQATTIDSFLNQKPALWSIRDGKLLIYGGGPQAFSLVFTTAVPPAPAPTPTRDVLVGPAWTLSGIATEGSNSGSGEGFSTSDIALTFDRHGTFHVRERCGDEAGSYTMHDNQVDFTGRHLAGEHSCPAIPNAGDRAAEQRRLAAVDTMLDGTVNWSIKSGQLLLSKGSISLTFDS